MPKELYAREVMDVVEAAEFFGRLAEYEEDDEPAAP